MADTLRVLRGCIPAGAARVRLARKLASNLRWRLKPVRWVGKAIYGVGDLVGGFPAADWRPNVDAVRNDLYEHFVRDGYAKLPRTILPGQVDLAALEGAAAGRSFVDVWDRASDVAEEAFARVVNDPDIADAIMRHFGGRPHLWNAALNYSDPSRGLTDSQMWHFDYGDTRQLHVMVYFSDVERSAGPFTFLPDTLSDRIVRHPLFIERLTDEELAARYDIVAAERAIRLVGRRGDVFLNDPGRLLHQGARCETPRMVLFISFTTRAPMSRGGRAVMPHARRARLIAARQAGRGASALPDHVFA